LLFTKQTKATVNNLWIKPKYNSFYKKKRLKNQKKVLALTLISNEKSIHDGRHVLIYFCYLNLTFLRCSFSHKKKHQNFKNYSNGRYDFL